MGPSLMRVVSLFATVAGYQYEKTKPKFCAHIVAKTRASCRLFRQQPPAQIDLDDPE